MKETLSRRNFLAAAGITGLTFALSGFSNPFKNKFTKKPNIVLVLVDDMGWVDSSVYGSKYYETPNMDRLASEGMTFTNAYAACAVCSPTRAAVMTGRYPARIGVTDWIHGYEFKGDRNDPNQPARSGYQTPAKSKKPVLCPLNPYWMELKEITIAEVLKKAGYTTCHVGKWHLGPDAWFPDKQGFDYNIGGCDAGQPPTYFDPYSKPENLKNNAPHVLPTMPSKKPGQYLTDREAEEAANFITKHKNKPFFLYLAHYAVHTPIEAKPELTEKYKAKPLQGQKDPEYAAMIESMDQALGKVLDTLEQNNLDKNTLVIFTSDNGGLSKVTNNAPLRAGKGWAYEGGIREPLIVKWPGVITPNTKCDVPVTSVDYFPTICQATNAPLPTNTTIDGKSIVPLLKQTAKTLNRDAIYWHYPHYRKDYETPYSIIRSGDWKLIKRYDGKTFELFNLKDDLSETNDLSEKMPEKVKTLDRKLTNWLKNTGAKLPKKNPNYKQKAKS